MIATAFATPSAARYVLTYKVLIHCKLLIHNVLIVGTLLLTGCGSESKPFDISQATYVGQAKCVSCHKEETQKWTNSHHDLAMQVATDETVLADFNNAELTHHGITSRMFHDGKRFIVNTEGPDGSMQDFEVKYVFGVKPASAIYGRVSFSRIEQRQTRWTAARFKYFDSVGIPRRRSGFISIHLT